MGPLKESYKIVYIIGMILLIDQSKSMFEVANQTVNYSNKHTMAIDRLNYEVDIDVISDSITYQI